MTHVVNHTLTMIEQEKLPEWIDRFNNNDLKGRELREFIELMKQNPELRREVKLDKDLNDILADTDILELREKVGKCKIPKESNHMRLPIFFLAASITILIGLAIFAFLWMKHDDETMMKTAFPFFYPSDSSAFKDKIPDDEQMALDIAAFDSILILQKQKESKTDNKLLLSNNYTPYPPYESMVGEVSRAISFRLIKPAATGTFATGNLITFAWETTSILSVIITITDNKGKSLFVSNPINGKKFLYNTSKLAKGLYYVKFISNDEIVYFGKFTLQ
jgi:hypothetical protein